MIDFFHAYDLNGMCRDQKYRVPILTNKNFVFETSIHAEGSVYFYY